MGDIVGVIVDLPKDKLMDAVGLMGSVKTGEKLGRDGVTVFEDMNDFGQEWQVGASDPILFESTRAPQHPQKCNLPDLTKETKRRLGETVAEEAAKIACKHLEDRASLFSFCVQDVMATGDLDLAQAGAF